MQYHFDLTLRRAEGAITRVLGAVERRRFEVFSLEAAVQPDCGRWQLRMTVEGDRDPESLLEKLASQYDCLEVEVFPCP